MVENSERANQPTNDRIPVFDIDCRYTTDQDLKNFAHTQIPDDPQHDPVIPFVEGTISYAGE